ncbi:MAG: hypothetical protein IPK83_20895 [Planctomycetes bacterium]|nr:hypothetical protein [Planctomycetota bacterium]
MPNQFSTTTAPNRNSFSAKCRVLRVIVAVAAIMLATSTSQAAVWYVKAGAATGGNGSNWSSAFRYLILATNAAQPGDQIWVAAGTYNPLDGNTDPNVTAFPRIAKFNMKAGVALYGGFLGTETSIGQRPVWDANGTGSPTILTADLNGNDIEADFPHGASYQDNAYRVLHVPPPTSGPLASDLTIIDGFTIKGGRANGADGVGFNKGGGIRIENGIVEIRRCLLQMNYATTGAGLWSNRDVLFDKSRFSGNKAGVDGAGAYVIAAVEASRCRFDHNDAGSSGGGLFRQGAAIISFCDFESNSAQGHGGASYNVTTASYLNCRMTNNFAGGLGGGAYGVSGRLIPRKLSAHSQYEQFERRRGVHRRRHHPELYDRRQHVQCDEWVWRRLFGVRRKHRNEHSFVGQSSFQRNNPGAIFFVAASRQRHHELFLHFRWRTGQWHRRHRADPVFVGGGDYHVQIGSPCNDAGTNDVAANPNDPLYSSVDLDQNIRWGNDPLITPDPGDATPPLPSDCGGLGNPCFVIDMGCYEFNSELAPFEIVYVNATVPPGSLRNGSSWANAMPSLKTAISIAAGSPEIREIWVARGTYMPDGGYIPLGGTRVAGTGARSDAFILTSDVSILGGFSGSESFLNKGMLRSI